MKKCPGCDKEIDKYGIVCDYCGRVEEENQKVNVSSDQNSNKSVQGNSGER